MTEHGVVVDTQAVPGKLAGRWPLAGLAAFLALSSLAPVQKYAGTAGLAVYIVVVFLVVLFGLRPAARWFAARLSEKQAVWLAAATLVFLGLVFAIVYPIADSGVVGGGSDREDNLTLATAALLHGRYPYYVRGYLGLPADTLPGALLLAVPFVLLGNSAFQNIFWLAVLLVTARHLLGDWRQALPLFWAALALAPALLLELVTGGELISNALYVLLFMLLLVQAASRSRWQAALYAVLLGVALAARVNFALLLPVIFSALAQRAGWRAAALYVGLAVAAFALLVAPFYLYDPAGFAPAHFQNVFYRFTDVLPSAGIVFPALTALVALALAARPVDVRGLLLNCALIQLLPIICGQVLTVLQAGALRLSFGVAGWGLFFLFFGLLALWPVVARPGGMLSH